VVDVGVERRRFPRVKADFGVEYKIKDTNSSLIKAVSVDISEAGIMMKTSEKLDIESLLELKLTLPSPYGNIDTLACVVHILENSWDESLPYRCGLEFRELKEEDRERIRKFVSDEIAKLDWERWMEHWM
jgi:c-di-GMP-binding flagellar brake protein YcgR